MRKKNVFPEFNARYGMRPLIPVPRTCRNTEKWMKNVIQEFWR